MAKGTAQGWLLCPDRGLKPGLMGAIRGRARERTLPDSGVRGSEREALSQDAALQLCVHVACVCTGVCVRTSEYTRAHEETAAGSH